MSTPIPTLPVLLQSLYGLAAASIVLANSIPALQRRFVGYGKTSPTTTTGASGLLDRLAALTVPHALFSHFYVCGVALSLFWMAQMVTRGPWYRCVAGLASGGGGGGAGQQGAMAIEQVVLAWACFLAQVARRLYECLYVQRSGGGGGRASRMWVAHYLVGLLFYAAMAVAVWVEGTGA